MCEIISIKLILFLTILCRLNSNAQIHFKTVKGSAIHLDFNRWDKNFASIGSLMPYYVINPNNLGISKKFTPRFWRCPYGNNWLTL